MSRNRIESNIHLIFQGDIINLSRTYGISPELKQKCIEQLKVQLLGFSRDQLENFLQIDLPQIIAHSISKRFVFLPTIKR